MPSDTPSKILKWPFYLGLLMAVTAVYFRLYPVTVYPRYQAENTAALVVQAKMIRGLESNVRSRFPRESEAKLAELTRNAIRDFARDQEIRLKGMTGSLAEDFLKDYRKSPQYLMEVDPYYYLDLTEHIIKSGKMADQIRGREYFNAKMLSPEGKWYPLDYHPYLGFYLYKIVSFFNPNASVMQAVSWLPLLLACAAIAPFIALAVFIFDLSFPAAAVAGLYFAVCPMFLKRSLFGWYDTDPYNILFPCAMLLILAFILREKRFSAGKGLALCLGLALVTAVYSLFWRGWMLLFSVYTLAAAAASVVTSSGQKGLLKERFKFLGIYVLFLAGFIFLFWGKIGLTETLQDAYQFSRDFFSKSFSLWPDVFISVGELRHSTFQSLSKLLGSPLIVLFSFFGILWSLKDAYKRKNPASAGMWALLFIQVVFFSLAMSAERFALLVVLPLCLSLGLAFKILFGWIENLLNVPAPQTIKSKIVSGLTFALAAFFLLAAFRLADAEIRADHPIYNVSWDKIMRGIKNKTPENAIITTWWSPGHFITGMAKRSVTFDGATQNTPQAYWVANLFLENSEEKALSILRMLDLSANQAVEYLEARHIPLSGAIDTLHKALPLPKDEAKKIYKDLLKNESQAGELLRLTHGDAPPRPGYLFIYDDMIRQVMALEYIGRWDFSKAEKFGDFLKAHPEKVPSRMLQRGTPDNAKLLWTLSDGPWPEDAVAYQDGETDGEIHFTNGLTLAKDYSAAVLDSKKFGRGRLLKLFYVKDGEFQNTSPALPTLRLSALIIQDEAESKARHHAVYQCVLGDERLLRSMAFRLFYLGGAGLKKIHLIDSEENPKTQNKFYLYKVDWTS